MIPQNCYPFQIIKRWKSFFLKLKAHCQSQKKNKLNRSNNIFAPIEHLYSICDRIRRKAAKIEFILKQRKNELL